MTRWKEYSSPLLIVRFGQFFFLDASFHQSGPMHNSAGFHFDEHFPWWRLGCLTWARTDRFLGAELLNHVIETQKRAVSYSEE